MTATFKVSRQLSVAHFLMSLKIEVQIAHFTGKIPIRGSERWHCRVNRLQVKDNILTGTAKHR